MANSNSAVVDEPEVVEKPRTDQKPDNSKPKVLPPYAVIVYNDDKHTFPYVIETFQKVFGYTLQKCLLLAKEIHLKGRSVVWSGSKEVAELKRDQIIGAGPDFHSPLPVRSPLKTIIEPMA